MAHHLARHRPRLLAPAILALFWACLRLSSAQAQASEGTHYTSSATLSIPFQMDEGHGRVQQLLLHVSDDLGKTYQHVANASPSDKAFTFSARRDGWYWFILQTQDSEGRLTPANLNSAQPGLKVCVDTVKPKVVTFKPVIPQEGTVAVEWEVSDENLDRMSLQLDYRPAGSSAAWVPLALDRLARGQLGWTPTFAGPCEVRLRVADKALNTVEATTTVTPSAAAAGRSTFGAAPEAKRGSVRFVKSKEIQLNYTIDNVGPSAVKSVEVWETRDTRSWRRLPVDAPPKGPYTVKVEGEGRYGFTLVPRSGVGFARPAPSIGEQPQLWVEVDETKPVVNISRIDVGRGPDTGKMTIYWTASDRHLQARPITISYATSPTGPFTELPGVGKLANASPHTVSCEGLPYEFFLRVEAVDEAGNVGLSQTRESVKVDLKIPVVNDLNVTGVEAKSPPP